MTIATVVMHDRRRGDRLLPLLQQLPDNTMVADGTLAGPWQALKIACYYGVIAEPKPSHVLILEDDAKPCADLLAVAGRMIASRPDDALYLYNGIGLTVEIHDALEAAGASWIRMKGPNPLGTVGVVLPYQTAKDFLQWGMHVSADIAIMEASPHRPLTGDLRLWVYLRQVMKRLPLIAYPSVVEHDCSLSDESLMGGVDGRHATVAVMDPDGRDWSGPVVDGRQFHVTDPTP